MSRQLLTQPMKLPRKMTVGTQLVYVLTKAHHHVMRIIVQNVFTPTLVETKVFNKHNRCHNSCAIPIG